MAGGARGSETGLRGMSAVEYSLQVQRDKESRVAMEGVAGYPGGRRVVWRIVEGMLFERSRPRIELNAD